MLCQLCRAKVNNGVIKMGLVYCSKEHADKHWREKQADRYAYNMSQGQYTSYEDYMHYEKGATIACESDNVVREF